MNSSSIGLPEAEVANFQEGRSLEPLLHELHQRGAVQSLLDHLLVRLGQIKEDRLVLILTIGKEAELVLENTELEALETRSGIKELSELEEVLWLHGF